MRPGLTRTGRDFDTLARRLGHRYRIVCPDLVGRGESDWLANPAFYTVPQQVADLTTLIARLAPSILQWVGTSLGGLVGMPEGRHWVKHYDLGIAVPFAQHSPALMAVGEQLLWQAFEALTCLVLVRRGAQSNLLVREMLLRHPHAGVRGAWRGSCAYIDA